MSAARPFTRAQRAQLQQLLAAGAIDRESAKGPFAPGMERCNAVVIGKLRDYGLADSRTVRQGGRRGGQHTAYWLTEAGAGVAREVSP